MSGAAPAAQAAQAAQASAPQAAPSAQGMGTASVGAIAPPQNPYAQGPGMGGGVGGPQMMPNQQPQWSPQGGGGNASFNGGIASLMHQGGNWGGWAPGQQAAMYGNADQVYGNNVNGVNNWGYGQQGSNFGQNYISAMQDQMQKANIPAPPPAPQMTTLNFTPPAATTTSTDAGGMRGGNFNNMNPYNPYDNAN